MRTEKTFGIIALLGLFWLFMDFPGYGLLLILSMGILVLLYFPFGFYFLCDKEIKQQNLIFSIISGWFFSTALLGIQFKLLDYPGADFMLFVGVIQVLIILIVAFLLKRKAKKELTTYYRNMLIRTSILTVLAIFFFFIPSTTLWKIQHRNDPELLNARIMFHEGRSDENHINFRRRRDSLRIEEWAQQRAYEQQAENETE